MKSLLVPILYFFGGITAFLLLVLLAAAATGRTLRAYSVLSPDRVVTVAGESLTVSLLAERYQPKVHLRPLTPSPELLWVWYEAVPSASTIDLVYHHAWENEIHPGTLIHTLYSGFRAAYYGYPLYDVEYFQVSVSRATGLVESVLFETSVDDEYFRSAPEHITARCRRDEGGGYRATSAPQARADVGFDGRRVMVGVQTWNHLTRLLEDGDPEYVDVQDAPLRFLDESDYRRHKFARKSQGDHHTPEHAATAPIAALARFLFVVVPASVLG